VVRLEYILTESEEAKIERWARRSSLSVKQWLQKALTAGVEDAFVWEIDVDKREAGDEE
jgi:hypothetical protein